MRVDWELLFKSYSFQTRQSLLYRLAIDLVGQVLQFTVLASDCKFVSRGFFDWLNWGQRHSLAVVPVEPVLGWLCHHTHDDFPALFHPVLWARSLYTHQCLLPVEKAFPSTLARYFTCKDWLWRVAQGWSLDKHLTAISTLHENRRSVTTLVLFHSYANTIIPESWKSLFHPCCERRSKTTWSAWQLTNSVRVWRALNLGVLYWKVLTPSYSGSYFFVFSIFSCWIMQLPFRDYCTSLFGWSPGISDTIDWAWNECNSFRSL